MNKPDDLSIIFTVIERTEGQNGQTLCLLKYSLFRVVKKTNLLIEWTG